MNIYRKAIPASLILGCAMIPAAWAVPTVTFQGEVTAQTCSVSINGQTNGIVMLPTVAVGDFNATVGKTTGLTPFTVSVANCTANATTDTPIKTKFLGHSVDSSTGVLGNVATTAAATGVGIQITAKSDGTSPVKLAGPTSVAGLVLPKGEVSASYDFGALYYALSATITSGAVTSVAEYSLSYL